MEGIYSTIESPTTAIFKDRGSKFLAYAYPLSNREQLKPILNELKKEHIKAVHFCLAYRLGFDGLDFRASDDGEPSGSAGKPILGQIDSLELTNVLVVVVRYFGGTLLGVPGLINAYKTATADCLAAAKIISKEIEKEITIEFDYNLLGEIMNVAKYFDASLVHQEMALFCRVTFSIPLNRFGVFQERLASIYGIQFL